jgi:TonB family protein
VRLARTENALIPMFNLPAFCRFAALIFVLCAPVALRAQTALYARHGEEFRWVRRVVGRDAYVDDGKGRLEPASERNYVLHAVPEFDPFFVSVRHLQVGTSSLTAMDVGDKINRQLEFRAEFESPFPLNNVFVVLDLNSEDAGKLLVLQEVGRLKPRTPRTIHIAVPLRRGIGAGHYRLHLYADGAEVFQSQMPSAFIEKTMDKMVRRRIAGIADAAPHPFIGPAPEYPAKLRRAGAEGSAVIEFTISPVGRVLDPRIKSASNPAFGEAALEAARLWRFLPQISAGVPVSALADMPFVFGEPEDLKKPGESQKASGLQ